MASAIDRIKQLFNTGASNALQAAKNVVSSPIASNVARAAVNTISPTFGTALGTAQRIVGGINRQATPSNLTTISQMGSSLGSAAQQWQNKPSNQLLNQYINTQPQRQSVPQVLGKTAINAVAGSNPLLSALNTGSQFTQMLTPKAKNLVSGALSPIETSIAGLIQNPGSIPERIKKGFTEGQNLVGALESKNVPGALPIGLAAGFLIPGAGEMASIKGLSKSKTIQAKILNTLNRTETPEEAVALIKNIEAKAVQNKSLPSLKNALKEWRKTLITGPGKPQDPLNKPIINEIDRIVSGLKTKASNVFEGSKTVFDNGIIVNPESIYGKSKAKLKIKPTEVGEIKPPKFKEISDIPAAKLPEIPQLPGGTINVKNRAQAVKAVGTPGVNVEVKNQLKPGTQPIILGDGTPKPTVESLRVAQKNLEKQILGVEIPDNIGKNTKPAGWWEKNALNLDSILRSKVTEMVRSDNPIIKVVGNLIKGINGDLVISPELLRAGQKMKGAADYGRKLANDLYAYTTSKLNKASLEKIHTILDPGLYGNKKVSESSLTVDEKEVLDILRSTADWIHDNNFVNGRISESTWLKNKGKYIARAYEEFEYPTEVNDLIKNSGLKFDVNQFKQRGDARADFIKDPAYLVTKRMQQMFFNDSVNEYMSFIRKTGDVSDVPKTGYTQLSENKMYGDLSGKWIPKEMMEQVKGFFFSNKAAQTINNALDIIDKNVVRQMHKTVLTALNPSTRLGNKTFNYLLDFLSGGDPVSFAKNRNWANNAIKNNDPIYIKALQEGVLGGSNYAKSDLAKISQQMLDGVDAKNRGWVAKKLGGLVDSYGKEDEIAKLAKIKEMLNKGYGWEQAVAEVNRSFQNYNMVGFLYNVASKIPVIGNPFVKFQGDLIRMMRNTAIHHPERLAAFLVTTKALGDLSSAWSNETEKDRATREGRPFQPKIPFTNIPLTFQTPYGEINAARLLGPSVFTKLGEDRTPMSDALGFLPINPTDLLNDPTVEPLISVLTDKDFRGKPISDPNMNKFTGSLLTPEEKRANQLNYLRRSYTPPALQAVEDVGRAAVGAPDFYGRNKTLPQTLLRATTGVKMEQFGAKEAEAARQKQAEYGLSGYESAQRNVNAIEKELAQGKITPEQAQKRIEAQQKSMTGLSEARTKDTYKFIGADGKVKEVDTSSIVTPKLSGDITMDEIRLNKFKTELRSRVKDVVEMYDAQKISEADASAKIQELNDMLDKYTTISKDLTKVKKYKSGKSSVKKPKKIRISISKLKTRANSSAGKNIKSIVSKGFKLQSYKPTALKIPTIKNIRIKKAKIAKIKGA